MISFSKFLLNEAILSYVKIDDFDLRQALKFQKAIRIYLEIDKEFKALGIKGSRVSESEVEETHKIFAKYKNAFDEFKQEPWGGYFTSWIQRTDSNISTYNKNKKIISSGQSESDNILKQGIAALKTREASKFLAFARANKTYLQAKNDQRNNEYDSIARAPKLTKSASILFQNAGFLQEIRPEDLEKIATMDLSSAYSGMSFPLETEDVEKVIYWFSKLADKPKQVEVSKGDMKKVLTLKYGDKEGFEELTKNLDNYLKSNSKEDLKKVLNSVGKIPELKEENEKTRRSLKKVYRGIVRKFDPDREKSQEFVATSKYEDVAERFVYYGGAHLLLPNVSRSGYLLEYDVDRSSILLDTEILGSVYNEAEVIIDPRKANLVSVKELDGRENDIARGIENSDEDYYDEDE